MKLLTLLFVVFVFGAWTHQHLDLTYLVTKVDALIDLSRDKISLLVDKS